MRWTVVLRVTACLLLGAALGTLLSPLLSPSVTEVPSDARRAPLFSAGALHQHALCGESVELRRLLTDQLAQIKAEIIAARESNRPTDYQVVVQLTRLMHRLDARAALAQLDPDELGKTFRGKDDRELKLDEDPDQNGYNPRSESHQEACPELYHGAIDDAPLHRRGFVTENCKDALPLERTVTVLLPVTWRSLPTDVERVLRQLHQQHPELPVVLTSSDRAHSRLAALHSELTVLHVPGEGRHVSVGTLVNRAARAATSPYVFMARDLTHVTEDLDLARHVRVLGRLPMVDVVGGAARNRSGHWRHGCFQAEVARHALAYRAGYQHSALECMLCDHVAGAFAARAETLRRLPLDAELPAEVVFHDWFLRLRRGARLAAVCPDLMHYSTGGEHSDEASAATWRQLAAKWQLVSLTLPAGRRYDFRCRDVGIQCNPVKTARYYSQPPCCLAQLEHGLHLLEKMLTDGRVQHELESGALLAAVKLAAPLPWGVNAHIAVNTDDFWYVIDRLGELRRHGLVVEEVPVPGAPAVANASSAADAPTTMFRVHTPAMLVTLRPERRFSTGLLPQELRTRPTLVRLGGVWMRAHVNPGRYARNRYGYDCLKHAVHWSYADDDMANEYRRYAAGAWPACPSRHHACLDQLPVDGSIGIV